MRLLTSLLITAFAVVLLAPVRAAALDDAHWQLANQSIEKGVAFLREQQNEDGSWMPDPGPAVTGLVLTALLDRPDIGPNDPTAAKAIRYILDRAQEDGSIRNGPEGILPSYNTALCLSALARVGNDPEVAEVIRKGQEYLRGSQWIVGMTDPNGKVIDENHPYVGGFGYGSHGRPDLSNTQIALQAMHDTGVDCNDPVFQRALLFLNKLQATEDNALYADKMAEHDGGFIYAPSIESHLIDQPESKANPQEMDEAKQGKPVSNLRTYGGMSYAGFKSLLFANLPRDDARVQAVLGWIANNYTFETNPGMPEPVELQGLYYYYITMARALNAYGSTTVAVNADKISPTIRVNPDVAWEDVLAATNQLQLEIMREHPGVEAEIKVAFDKTIEGIEVDRSTLSITVTRDWANDLIDKLTAVQREDGSWVNTAGRWMEDQPVLVTAYAVIALENALD